jgi:phosphoribosylanthranilate isomerase
LRYDFRSNFRSDSRPDSHATRQNLRHHPARPGPRHCPDGGPRPRVHLRAALTAQQIREIVDGLPEGVARVGVFMNADFEEMVETVQTAGLTSLQLHGNEDPEFCRELRSALPQIELIKAFRVRSGDLAFIEAMTAPYNAVDWFLLDAYHPSQGGGTGQTLDWLAMPALSLPRPWFLAGGLRPDNVLTALGQVQPQGIDLSSGVEQSPGNKDMAAVQALFAALQGLTQVG